MPSAAIMFGNQQATGDQPLAGAPEIAYNVVMDGAGAVRRRPGIVLWDDFPEIATSPGVSGGTFYDEYIVDTSPSGVVWDNFDVRSITSFRGYLVWVNGIYSASHGSDARSDVWWMDSMGTFQLMGIQLPGAARPRFAETSHRLHVVAGGNSLVPYGLRVEYDSATNTLGGFSWPGTTVPNATQVEALAQRLYLNNTATTAVQNRILYTSPGSTGNLSIGPLSFTSAEARPDAVVALRENSNELFVFGSSTLQVFVPDQQITLAPQRTINRGCSAASSVVSIDEEFAWLDDQRQIVVSDGRHIEQVSDPIATDLDNMEDVSDAYGFRVNSGQFDLLVWQFPEDSTRCYQKHGGWSQWSTWDPVGQGHEPIGIKSHYYWSDRNVHLVGMADGQIARLSETAYTDLGAPIVAEVTTGFYNHGTDAIKFTDALHLTFKRGQTAGSTEPLVLLSWRDAQGAAFCPPRQIGLGTTGDYVSTVTLRTLGGYRRRQWKLVFSADVELVLAGCEETFSFGSS